MDNPTGELLDMLKQEQFMHEYDLTSDQKDALGEVGNICMGTSATTLSTILGKKVSITTPRVSVNRTVFEIGHYQKPFWAVDVSYIEGIEGYNVLLMKDSDVFLITSLMLGSDEEFVPGMDLDELRLSAISEVMNQMVGSSASFLADLIGEQVNISPPNVRHIRLDEDELGPLSLSQQPIIKISFNMEIEGVLKSELMQLMPFDFGKSLAQRLLGEMMEEAAAPAPQPPQPEPIITRPAGTAPAVTTVPPAAPQPAASSYAQQPMMPQQPIPQQPIPQQGANFGMPYSQQPQAAPTVGVKSVQYQSFDEPYAPAVPSGDNINLILDVPLQVTVELGSTKKSIKEILAFNSGSVIVLERLAGEMVDILVNGKLFARGEVVVIDDNYGVRITDIVSSPSI